jgi:hypothetical protein
MEIQLRELREGVLALTESLRSVFLPTFSKLSAYQYKFIEKQ